MPSIPTFRTATPTKQSGAGNPPFRSRPFGVGADPNQGNDGQLVFDRAGLLLCDLSLEQLAPSWPLLVLDSDSGKFRIFHFQTVRTFALIANDRLASCIATPCTVHLQQLLRSVRAQHENEMTALGSVAQSEQVRQNPCPL